MKQLSTQSNIASLSQLYPVCIKWYLCGLSHLI